MKATEVRLLDYHTNKNGTRPHTGELDDAGISA
jgi:hypothetical protein